MSATEDKLRRATDRIAQLTEQMKTHEKQETARTSKNKATEKNMREICEKILAKRDNEMKLGQAYAWDNIDIDTLLKQTKEAYAENEKSQKNKMLQLLSRIDTLRALNESLKSQIIRIKQNPTRIPEDPADVQQRADNEKKNKNSNEANEQNKPAQPGPNSNQAPDITIIEEGFDALTGMEEGIIADTIKEAQKMKPTMNSVPVKRSKKTKAKISQISKDIESQVAVVKLSDYEKKVTDVGWAMMQVIGEQGLSRYTDIEPMVIKMNKNWSIKTVRLANVALTGANICISENIKGLPVAGKAQLLYLSPDIGEALFEAKFNKKPVQPECFKIKTEHNNYLHGYGIKEMYDILLTSERYESVEMFHRKGKAIDAGNNQKYIPDITVKDKTGTIHYIEYELGDTPTTDFNAKCSKIANIASTINIVTPNKKVTNTIKKQVVTWVNNRGIKALAGIKVRVSTVKSFKAPTPKEQGLDIRPDKNWAVVFDLSRGIEPVEHF